MAAMKQLTIVALTITVGTLAGGLYAQPATFKRTVLQQVDISAPGREVVTAMVEFQPGGSPGRHTHPGEEVGYVVEGSILLEQEGKPSATLKAGQRAGANYEYTVQKLQNGECTPMEEVLDCCDWLINSPRAVVSGRNFSVVFDHWGDPKLEEALLNDPNLYKLRRFGNNQMVRDRRARRG